MSTPFIGEIRLFGGNFAIRGFAFCHGQLISIAQNTALFALIGTTYGGNGQTTFALPDLRGRVPVGQGQGPGLPGVTVGQTMGSEFHTLSVNEMPIHGHAPQASLNTASSAFGPPAAPGVASTPIYDGGAPTTPVGASLPAGSSQPHDNMAPSLALHYLIALEGLFPTRN